MADISDLKNLNIIWGRNNTGKSAILQAILFMKQSIATEAMEYIQPIDFNSFDNLIFKHDKSNVMNLRFDFGLSNKEVEALSSYAI